MEMRLLRGLRELHDAINGVVVSDSQGRHPQGDRTFDKCCRRGGGVAQAIPRMRVLLGDDGWLRRWRDAEEALCAEPNREIGERGLERRCRLGREQPEVVLLRP